MNQTLELVKEMATQPRATPINEHYKRLEDLTGRQFMRRTLFDVYPQAKTLQEIGFRWFVTPAFALRFKYHASLLGRIVGKFSSERDLQQCYWYRGDIPDSIIDNIERFKSLSQKAIYPITIHSMEPLPLFIENIPRQLEPIVIGWFSNRAYFRFDDTWWGWRCGDGDNALGVILGIWDKEKELKVI